MESLSHDLIHTYGIQVSIAPADISQRYEVEAAVNKITQELGTVDILINNAGIAQFGLLAEMSPEDWERIMQVNVMGTYYVTRAVFTDDDGTKIAGMSSIFHLQQENADLRQAQLIALLNLLSLV
ncbi:hypothetical protein GCM10020331_093300 [Ectobacillus funiculus]